MTWLYITRRRRVHTSQCPAVTPIAQVLRQVTAWKWADQATPEAIAREIHRRHLRPCRTCQPFERGEIQP